MTSVPSSRASRRGAVLLAVGAVLAAACGSGESALNAGLDRPAPATTAAPPADGAGPDGDGGSGDGGGSGDDAIRTGDSAVDTGADPGDESGPNDEPGPDSTGDGSGSGDGMDVDVPTTTPGPTTTAVPLADLPPCPVDALDDVDGPVSVTLWFGLAGDLPGVLQGLADEYNASQDRVVVDIENQTDYGSVVDKFTQFSVGERPELILGPEYNVQAFAQSEQFIPIDACIEASGFDMAPFLPGALNAYRFNGVQWGIPFNASNPVLYYNRAMFEAAGLDPDDPPLTFDELEAVSQQLVDTGAAATGLIVDTSRDSGTGGASFEQWFGRAGVAFSDNGNGRIAPATQVFFGGDFGVDLLSFLAGMVDRGLATSVGENASGQAGLLALADREAPGAMVIETSAALGTVLVAVEGGLVPGITVDDIGVGFMPGPTDSPGAQIGGGSLWIPAGKGDAAAAAAWDFVRFLVSAQSQATWAAGTGYVPVRTDAVDLDPVRSLWEVDPRWRVAYDQLVAVSDDPLANRPILGPQREVRQEIADAIATVYLDPGGADIAAILAAAQSDANDLVANYNALN